MSDLQKYISQRKQIDPEFAKKLDDGYQTFKIGRLLRQAREIAGLTQEEVANKLHTKKSAISRMENHPEDMSLSTLGKLAAVLGNKIEIILYSAK